MFDLRKHEVFELEVLDKLNTRKILNKLVFLGGTMLRLCYGLDRYSVDLDFWVIKKTDFKKLLKELINCLGEYYEITDSAEKYSTILIEVKSPQYPRSLKIEIRKETNKMSTDTAIAFSKFSNIQVMVNHVSLSDMMALKIAAFLYRNEIRDVYDIEFLYKKGIPVIADKKTLKDLLNIIQSLNRNDYNVKLGSILEPVQRIYYKKNNFSLLKMHIKEKLIIL